MEPRINRVFIFLFFISVFAYIGYEGYRYHRLSVALDASRVELATTSAAFTAEAATREIYINELEASTTALRTALTESKNDYYILLNRLAVFETDNIALQEQMTALAGELGILNKLSKTDRELLQKYSKVYFLNENYVPGSLATITPEYLFAKDKPLQIHTNVALHLTQLLDTASSTGNPLLVTSAYRSFGTQAQLKSTYVVTYGSGANKFSAEQGYSEHQLGTTVDLTTLKVGVPSIKFEGTLGYVWLTQNAYRYGFIMSYPKQNTYYQFEPWHWRFVGVALATELHNEGKYFYDLDQREIDTYLVNIFD